MNMYLMGSPPCKWILAFLFNDFLDLERGQLIVPSPLTMPYPHQFP
jgi:hypothetical protein